MMFGKLNSNHKFYSNPAFDRMLGIRLGAASVNALMNGERNVMAGILDNQLKFTPFDSVVKQHQLNEELYGLLKTLNT